MSDAESVVSDAYRPISPDAGSRSMAASTRTTFSNCSPSSIATMAVSPGPTSASGSATHGGGSHRKRPPRARLTVCEVLESDVAAVAETQFLYREVAPLILDRVGDAEMVTVVEEPSSPPVSLLVHPVKRRPTPAEAAIAKVNCFIFMPPWERQLGQEPVDGDHTLHSIRCSETRRSLLQTLGHQGCTEHSRTPALSCVQGRGRGLGLYEPSPYSLRPAATPSEGDHQAAGDDHEQRGCDQGAYVVSVSAKPPTTFSSTTTSSIGSTGRLDELALHVADAV